MFAVVSGFGVAFAQLVPRRGLEIAGAIALLAFATVDLLSRRRGSYCKIGLLRQTPQKGCQSVIATAALWGFDTGLAVTTVRVTAATWAALAQCALGLSSPWAGVAYGVSFALPIALLLWNPQIGLAASSQEPVDPGLAGQLKFRSTAQLLSMVTLTVCAVLILWKVIANP